MKRPTLTALVRAAHGLFFFVVSAYCVLSYTPFAFDVFIKPGVSPGLTTFILQTPLLFWLVFLSTVATLRPALNAAQAIAGRSLKTILVWSYLVTSVAVGIAMVVMQPLLGIGHSPIAIVFAVLAVCWPVWLSAIDHVLWPSPVVRASDSVRTLIACVGAAVCASGMFALAAVLRLRQAIGVELTGPAFVSASLSSTVFTLAVFTVLFLVLRGLALSATIATRNGRAEYWGTVALLATAMTLVLYRLVCAAFAFSGAVALTVSVAMAVSVAATWAGIARIRGQHLLTRSEHSAATDEEAVDALTLFGAPVAGMGDRTSVGLVIVVLLLLVSPVMDRLREYDWNFLLQKLTVLAVWMFAFAAVYAVVPTRPLRARRMTTIGVPLLVLLLFGAVARFASPALLDRYAAVDPSVRLIRDAQVAPPSGTADLYAVLRAHTLLSPRDFTASPARSIDLVSPLTPARDKPHIFLLVVDSLRPDYLSPYNPAVSFTPSIARLAEDSYVFRRALTPYGGTALSVPAIWAGGLVPHAIQQPHFGSRNLLLKLLMANDYMRLMEMDSVVETLMSPARDGLVVLNPGTSLTRSVDLCESVGRVDAALNQAAQRPVFFYSLPQNVHMGVASRVAIPASETYPAAFDRRIASSVHRLDSCIDRFVQMLKQRQIYDDSVIILTSDHGDLLGEQGRWGHAFWIYPEIMNVPLIVRVPPRLRPSHQPNLDAMVLSTDITPTLYGLLGYEPRDLGPLFGRSLLPSPGGSTGEVHADGALLASSYGAVYGVTYDNGRRAYVVDTVNGREYALDMQHESPPIVVPPATADRWRQLIQRQLADVQATFGYGLNARQPPADSSRLRPSTNRF